MKRTEIMTLLDDLLDDTISEADFLRLEAEMTVDQSIRQLYYERLQLAMTLEAEAESALGNQNSSSKIVSIPKKNRSWIKWGAAAAVLLGCFLVAQTFLSSTNGFPPEMTAEGFGVIGSGADAVWKGEADLRTGGLLPVGRHFLEKGLAEVNLFSGVTLVLEGPAEFEIHSPMEMSLFQGRLRARVPVPAQGFRVRTKIGEVVDLGTEFALDLTGANPELHVLDGEVEWHPAGSDGPSHNLLSGNAMTLEGELRLTADPERFAGTEQLRQRRLRGLAESGLRWAKYQEKLHTDPQLLVAYTFDEEGAWDGVLKNRSPEGSSLDGAIVAAQRSEGRWPGVKSALDFQRPGSRVRLAVPGEFNGLTFSCWASIDQLDHQWNSLFLTDGYDVNEVHWQITGERQLFLSARRRKEWVSSEKSVHVPVLSPPIWSEGDAGQWIHLATSVDALTGEVVHYRNGKVVHREVLPPAMRPSSLKLGGATLGNWSLPLRDDPSFSVRNLDGRIDEFLLFSDALSADQIQEIYVHGKP